MLNIHGRRVFLVGCGGGCDVCAGYMLYRTLIEDNEVFLGNYSFTDDLYKYGNGTSVKITGDEKMTDKNALYFPEKIMAAATNTPVHTFRLYGPSVIAEELEKLCTENKIDLVILIDAGCDALLFGDEGEHKGSPLEDMSMLIASMELKKNIDVILCCVSVTTDDPYACFSTNYMRAKRHKCCIGQWKPTDKEHIGYYKAMLDMFHPSSRSIPNESLLASLEGISEHGYKNPRLAERNIDTYPDVIRMTSTHFLFDARKLVETSPLASHLYKDISKYSGLLEFNGAIQNFYSVMQDAKKLWDLRDHEEL